MGKCKVREAWFSAKDQNGYLIKDWAAKADDEHVFCRLCTKKFSVASAGFDAVTQHSSGKKHIKACNDALAPNQLRLGLIPVRDEETTGTTEKTQPSLVRMFSVQDEGVAKALQWTLKCIASDFSASSCDGIVQLFACMFGAEAVENFSLSSTKQRYLLTDALYPCFRDELIEDIGGSTYRIDYDETVNSANAKEMQVGIAYWSKRSSQVVYHHLQTFFIGSATAEKLVEKINLAVNNASLSPLKILMLNKDGPNVNKKVERLYNAQLIELGRNALIDIGSCDVHVIHNAFLAGLKVFGMLANDIVFKLHYYFHQWPLRREDYLQIQIELNVPLHVFIKHVNSRWLTLGPATERVIEQRDALIKYFLEFVPENRKETSKSSTYKEIVQLLKKKDTFAQLQFVSASTKIFTRFTGAFQASEPMIQVMHDELDRLARTLLGRVCKPTAVANLGVCTAVLQDSNLRTPGLTKLDDNVEKEIKNAKLDEEDVVEFLGNAQKHFVAACRHVIKTSSISNDLVKRCRCLLPRERRSPKSVGDIVALAKALPVHVDVSLLQDEWRLLQIEEDNVAGDGCRIDTYWSQFFHLKTDRGEVKFPTVATVVKSALTLAHSNAEVERGFSSSSRYLSKDRASMSERTLNAAMTVKSGLKKYDMKPELVPITKKLLDLGHHAHASYKAYLEEQKMQKERGDRQKRADEEKRMAEEALQKEFLKEKSTLLAEEEKLKELKKNDDSKRKTEEQMFREATKRLKTGIDKGDMNEISMAQAMLDGLSKVRKEIKNKNLDLEKARKLVDQKKTLLIKEYVQPKPKDK